MIKLTKAQEKALEPLNRQQRAFLVALLADETRNQSAAYCAAYGNKSAKVAGVSAARLLANARVRRAWAVLEGGVLERAVTEAVMSKQAVLLELSRLASLNPRACFDERGNLRPLKDWPDATLAALGGFEIVKRNLDPGDGFIDTVHKVKFWDKTKALTDLAKFYKLLTDVVEVHDDEALIARLVRGRERARKAKDGGK